VSWSTRHGLAVNLMATIYGNKHKPWTTKHIVSIKDRSPESLQEILRLAADRLQDLMGEDTDEGTIALINELDRVRRDIY